MYYGCMSDSKSMPASYWAELRANERQIYESVTATRKAGRLVSKHWLGGAGAEEGYPHTTHYTGSKASLLVPRTALLLSGCEVFDGPNIYHAAEILPDKEQMYVLKCVGYKESLAVSITWAMKGAACSVFGIVPESMRPDEMDYEHVLSELQRGASGEYDVNL